MIAFALYLLKVVLCSGLLYLYYLVALRNRLFHGWNRFYLLAAVLLSLVIPLIQITVTQTEKLSGEPPIQLLQVVESTNAYLEEITVTPQQPTGTSWIVYIYMAVGVFFLSGLLAAILKIIRLLRSHESHTIGNVRFINTGVRGAPFSFLHFIFWHRDIDINSSTGQQVFRHELVHVQEKHTLDKLFMQLVLVVFWSNPFFWLIRKELQMVHEFIADQKAVSGNGAGELAAMILQAAYPGQFSAIINPYYQTSIKRRLTMITKHQSPRLNYFSRLIALPLAAIVVLGFSIRSKTLPSIQPLQKTFTVVIDAGHGWQNGRPSGAQAGSRSEDDIVLDIAKKIAALNQNPDLQIILSRTDATLVPLADRVTLAREKNADLFLSLHLSSAGAANSSAGGMEVYVPGGQPSYKDQSERFASVIRQEIASVYTTNPVLQKRQSTIYVLDKNSCPAVLLECGYLTNARDLEFISSGKNQDQLALQILKAIQKYATAAGTSANALNKTITTLTITEKDTALIQFNDGTADKMHRQDAIRKYGETVIIEGNSTKESARPLQVNKDTLPDGPIFEVSERAPKIDDKIWRQFLSEQLSVVIPQIDKEAPAGSYTVKVRFVVEQDGSLSDIKALNDPGYGIAEKITEVLKRSPKWTPARQNGRKVRAYYTQPVTLVLTEEKD